MRTVLIASLIEALAVLSSACAPPKPPVALKGDDAPMTDPEVNTEKGVDVHKARALLARAEEALKKKDYAGVKRLCDQADRFADDVVRDDMTQLLQRADQSLAGDLSPPVLDLANSGKCKEAAEKVAGIGEDHKGTTVIVFVKNAVSKPLLACLLKALQIDVSVARDLSEVDAIKVALNPEDFEQWDNKLDEATVGTLVAALQEPIQARAWPKAVKALDDMVARNDAGPRDVHRSMRIIRAGIGEDVAKKVSAALANKFGVSVALKEVDGLIAAGRWDDKDPLPEEIAKKRTLLAFWAVCAAQDCILSDPAPNWAYGGLEVKPPLDLGGKAVARIKHGRQVWRIAEGKAFSLIADHDPGALDGIEPRLSAALGWVPAAGLSASDTAERLPPGEAIVGTRVWGGLRDKQKDWELGVVREQKGEQLTVERISDGKMVKAQRSQVRFGTVKKGTKVLTLCRGGKMAPATIDEVVPIAGAEPHVKLTCLDDKGGASDVKAEVLLGTLRGNPLWLPPRQ